MNRKRIHSDESEITMITKKIKKNGCVIILMELPGSGKSYLTSKITKHINQILEHEYNFTNLNPDNVIINSTITLQNLFPLNVK